MSALEKRLVGAAKQALAVIDDVADTGIALAVSVGAPHHATSALRVISTITKAVQAGFEREIAPAEVLESIEKAVETMRSSIADNDAAANAEVDAKFPPGSRQPVPNTRDVYDDDPRATPKP